MSLDESYEVILPSLNRPDEKNWSESVPLFSDDLLFYYNFIFIYAWIVSLFWLLRDPSYSSLIIFVTYYFNAAFLARVVYYFIRELSILHSTWWHSYNYSYGVHISSAHLTPIWKLVDHQPNGEWYPSNYCPLNPALSLRK